MGRENDSYIFSDIFFPLVCLNYASRIANNKSKIFFDNHGNLYASAWILV